MACILVLHHNDEDLGLIRRYLSFLGYKVEEARTGEEACNLFDKDQDCGLVITTMKVQDIGGNDLAKYIRNSRNSHTPIVAIGTSKDNIERDLFNTVLMTPLKLKVLGDSVSSFLPPIARLRPISPIIGPIAALTSWLLYHIPQLQLMLSQLWG